MRTGLIAIPTAVGFMALTTSANAAAASPQAAAATPAAPSVSTLVMPSGGAGQAQAAGVPRVSPSVRRSFVSRNSYQYCPNGYLCAFVPYGSGFYRFDFTSCRQYRLANWYGTGAIFNAQYGGVRFKLLTPEAGPSSPAQRRVSGGIGWSPVYYVRPC